MRYLLYHRMKRLNLLLLTLMPYTIHRMVYACMILLKSHVINILIVCQTVKNIIELLVVKKNEIILSS